MADRNALVDGIKSLKPPGATITAKKGKSPPARMEVNFAGGQTGYLDMEKPKSKVWAEVLESIGSNHQTAYVELDPGTQEITELLVPIEVTVGTIGDPDKNGDIEIEFVISHARHFLRKENPEYDKLLQVLKEAYQKKSLLIVTENDKLEIVDLRLKSETGEGGQ